MRDHTNTSPNDSMMPIQTPNNTKQLPEALNVSILTWNMGEKSPPMSDVAMLAGMGLNSSDLTVLGVQEVENLKPRRHEGSRSREWRRLILKTLGRTHALLSLTSLGGLQLAVLAKCVG